MTIAPSQLDAGNYPFIAQIITTFSREITGGSGILIGPRLILTAGHVVYDPTWGGEPEEFAVTLGGEVRKTFRTDNWRSTTRWIDHDSRLGTLRAISGADLGVVILDEPVDSLVKPIRVETGASSEIRDQRLNVAGYPVRHGDELYGASSFPLPNAFPEYSRLRIFYPIETEAGMSGGPAWDFDPESQLRIARGVHTSIFEGIGSALRVTPNVLSLIQEWQGMFGSNQTDA